MNGRIEIQRVARNFWCWSITLGAGSIDALESYETELEARQEAAAWAKEHGIRILAIESSPRLTATSNRPSNVKGCD